MSAKPTSASVAAMAAVSGAVDGLRKDLTALRHEIEAQGTVGEEYLRKIIARLPEPPTAPTRKLCCDCAHGRPVSHGGPYEYAKCAMVQDLLSGAAAAYCSTRRGNPSSACGPEGNQWTPKPARRCRWWRRGA